MKYLLISLLFIIICFLLLSVKFKITYMYNNNHSNLKISTLYLFGLFKPELYPFDKKKKSKDIKSNTFIKFRSFLKDPQYKRLIDYIRNKSIFQKVTWITKIGLEDVLLVGIIYGIIWACKSMIINFILTNKEINYIDIDVVPIFNKNQLDISLDCIIKIRMVYIITIWIWFLKLNKGGEKNDRTSNRRLNENYNE